MDPRSTTSSILSASEVHPITPDSLPPETQSGAPSTAPPGLLASDPLSKSALKRAAKAEKFAERKLERRAAEKAAKKEKRRLLAEKRAAGEDVDDGQRKKKKRKLAAHEKSQFGGQVVVDLGFDDMMTEKEIISLTSQLAHTHSSNRQALFPFSLIFSSLNGRTLTRLESINESAHERWANTQWWTDGYEKLWKEPEDSAAPDEAKKPQASSSQENVVYLTADSDDELTELIPGETYIIGGIVDHNRYKNLCLHKAKESGVRTARLPIGTYIADLKTRKVLTVNQVFDIMLHWVETRDWAEALYRVIPKRKFGQASKNGGDAEDDGEYEHADPDDVVQQGL